MISDAILKLLPLPMRLTCRRLGVQLTEHVLLVDITAQRLTWVMPVLTEDLPFCITSIVRKRSRISTSRFGIGEKINSNCTPRGLHRVARKTGGGWPVGAVFRSRKMTGYTWDGQPGAPITNRIFWLEGAEPGKNRGGDVDTFARYIYIHGTGDEPSFGRPAPRGWIHKSGAHLFAL
jgi:hypothetical protein